MLGNLHRCEPEHDVGQQRPTDATDEATNRKLSGPARGSGTDRQVTPAILRRNRSRRTTNGTQHHGEERPDGSSEPEHDRGEHEQVDVVEIDRDDTGRHDDRPRRGRDHLGQAHSGPTSSGRDERL
jgi:hypothetical protein